MARLDSALIAVTAPLVVLVSLLVYLGLYEHVDYFQKEPLRPCDNSNTSVFAQPNASWSSLAYVIVGLAACVHASVYFEQGVRVNMHTAFVYVPIIHTASLAFVGTMSMFYHGFLTRWAAELDGISMLFLISLLQVIPLIKFLIMYRNFPRTRGQFHFLFWGLILVKYTVDILVVTLVHDDWSREVYIATNIGVVLLLETSYCSLNRSGNWYFLFWGIVFMAVAFVFWFFSGSRCDLQAHSVWHALTGMSLYFTYLYHAFELGASAFMVPGYQYRVMPVGERNA